MNDNKIFVIARIMNNNKLLGFKLIDSYNGECRNISCDQAKFVLNNGKKIENLKLVDGELKGKGGALSRYTAINTVGEIISENSIVILRKADDITYICTTYTGKRGYFSAEQLLAFSYTNKIANARVFKNDSGKICIVPIEGSYDTEETQYQHIKINKKYVLPEAVPNKEYKYGYFGTNISKAISNGYILGKLGWVKPKMLYRKYGIAQVSYLKKGITYVSGCNEVLYPKIYMDNKFEIKIVGIKIGNNTQLLISLNNRAYLLEDILYIGDAWGRLIDSNTEDKTFINKSNINNKELDTKIIGIGHLGLMILCIKNDFTKSLEDKCIPYQKIADIDSLTHHLVENGITSSVLSKTDINYILNVAKSSPYKFKFDIDLSTIPSKYVSDNKLEEMKKFGLKNYRIIDCQMVNNISYDSLNVVEHLEDEILCELKLVMKDEKTAYFNCCNKAIRHRGERVRLKVLDDELRIDYKSIKVKYIIYYILQSYGKITDCNPDWISTEDINEIMTRLIWSWSVKDDDISIYIDNIELTYSISKLKEDKVNEDKKFDTKAKEVSKVMNKLGLLGESIKLNKEGYIVSWANGDVIEQSSAIKGIIITEESAKNIITININDEFDAIKLYKFPFSIDTENIRLAYKAKDIDKYLKLRQGYRELKALINLANQNSDEIRQLLAVILRGFVDRVIKINGEEVNMSIKTLEYGLDFLVRNAGKLYSLAAIDAITTELNRSITGIFKTVQGKNKIKQSEKADVIKHCLVNIPKRISKNRDYSIAITRAVIYMLYDGEELSQMLDSFEKWAAK